jgi:hypothetical protein
MKRPGVPVGDDFGVTTGPVPAIVGWIAAVEEAYPYLVTEQLTSPTTIATGQASSRRSSTTAILAEPERTG